MGATGLQIPTVTRSPTGRINPPRDNGAMRLKIGSFTGDEGTYRWDVQDLDMRLKIRSMRDLAAIPFTEHS